MANKFEGQGYAISIVAKHFQITDAIRNYVFEKLGKVEHVADRIIDITVTLDTQKLEHTCAILVNFLHFHIQAHASTDNVYSAIDKASDKVLKLIRRYKGKLQSHRAKHLSTVDIHVNVVKPLRDEVEMINRQIEEENQKKKAAPAFEFHKVVAKESVPLKLLTQDEAVMKLEMSGEPFLIYKSEENQKVAVLYRRPDENYSLVQIH